jgi:mono/diheme cytochrome c family protein
LSAVAQTSPVAADDIEQGKLEYHRNCASCHGNDGNRASKREAEDKTRGPDDAGARRIGGTYSPAAIYEMIDGRNQTASLH